MGKKPVRFKLKKNDFRMKIGNRLNVNYVVTIVTCYKIRN